METKRVYNVERYELLDGTEMEVRPFSIKKNRKAKELLNRIINSGVKKDEEGKELEDEFGQPIPEMTDEEAEAIFIDVVAMAMIGQSSCAHLLDDRDKLEDSLDDGTVFAVIKATTGYDFLAMQERAANILTQIETEKNRP